MENGSTVVVAENSSVDTIINKQMFGLFIDEKKVKRNIIVPLSNINSELVVNNERKDGGGERFNTVLQDRSVYLKCMEKSMKIKIEISNVKTQESNQQYKTQATSDKNYVATHKSFNANPWNIGLLRHRTDPLNAMCQSVNVQKGNVSTQMNMPLTPQLLNVLRKIEDQQILRDTYKGMLLPERQNLNYKVNVSSDSKLIGAKLVADKKTDSGKLMPVNTGNYTIDSPIVDLSKLLSVMPSQQMFDDAVYTFTKSQPTYNYRWDKTGATSNHTFVRTTRTKELYTIKVGKYSYPTNIENYEDFLAESDSPGLGAVYWYCNKQKLIKKVTGTPPAEDDTKNGDDEPLDQRLNIKIELEASGPVFHPLLQTIPDLSFSNIQTFKIEATYHSDLYKNMFYNMYKPILGEDLGTPKVTVSDQKLRITQLDCALLENSIKPRIALNYTQFKEFTEAKTVRLKKVGNKIGFDPIAFNMSCGFTGHVPKRALIFLSSENNLPYKFVNPFNLTFAGQNSVVQQPVDDLINASRLNGLHMTVNDQFNSYPVMSKYANIKLVPSQCGTVLYLEYANNLPIMYNQSRPLTAGSFADGMSSNYKIIVDGMFESDIDYDLNKDYVIQMNIYHLNDCEAIYAGNKIETRVLGFDNKDLAVAISETKNAAERNELTANVDEQVLGGKTIRKIKRNNTQSSASHPSSISQPSNGFMSDYMLKR